MKLSIVVPCYNEEGNIKKFYDEVYKVFVNKKISYEIIFINDGSKDDTLNKLNNLLLENRQKMKIINFSRNFGKEAAMLAGLKESKGEFVSIIDADLQQRPELIIDMFDFLQNNKEFDSVAAFQEKRKEGSILTFFKNCFYKLINYISDIRFVQGASDFRMFRRNMVNEIINMSEYHRFSKGLFSFVGFNTYYMPYVAEQRYSGNTTWSFIKLINYAIEGIEAFTTKPLRLSFAFSFLSFLVAFIFLVVSLINGMNIINFMLFWILFMIGLLFIALGIIGEYLSKTYIQCKNRPIYIIKSIKESK
ncbi:MAG: glycosyltransferase family 2 protein [bacterium]|nr:glycosyltransferase family 2 protein [bacterium]